MYSQDKMLYAAQAYPNSPESRQVVLHSLCSLEKLELDFGADFTLIPIEHLQPAFNRVVSAAWIGANNMLRHFRQYARWRRAQGLPCGDGVFDLRIDQTIAIRQSMVPSPGHLSALLNVVFDPPSMRTIDIVYRVFLWMGFSGLEDRQAVSITAKNVHLERRSIETASDTYPVYDESVQDFAFAIQLRSFMSGNKMLPRADGDGILRGRSINRKVNTDAMLTHTLRPTIARKFATASKIDHGQQRPAPFGLDTTYSKILLSGVFYRLHQCECDGEPPNFDAYAARAFDRAQRSDRPYRVSVHNPKAAVLLRLKKTARTDYANWKNAFNLK